MPANTHGLEMQEIVLNPFAMHLSDAILATHLIAHAQSRPEVRSMHSRTAVAHSVFALECAANAFIAELPRNHHFRDQAEKWTALDKFDLYLLSLPNNPKIPRDDARIRSLQELIKIRDKHVHPRSIRCKVSEATGSNTGFVIEWPEGKDYEIKPMSFGWDEKDAQKALEIVLNFLRLFFELAKVTKPQITLILFAHIICTDGRRRVDVGNFQRLLSLSSSINLDVSFLDPGV